MTQLLAHHPSVRVLPRWELPPIAPPDADAPVFAATSARRAVAVGLIGRAVAACAAAWMIALGVGAAGFDSLPPLDPATTGHAQTTARR